MVSSGHYLASAAGFRILEEGVGDRVVQGLSEIEFLRLQDEEKAGRLEKKESLQKLEKIIADYRGVIAVEARGFLEMGKLSLVLEEPEKALEFFQKVTRQYSTEREISAEAAFSQNHIYALVGNREKLVESFVQVVRDYPDVKYWKQKSMEAILQLYENQPTLEKKVSSLQALAETEIPLLSTPIRIVPGLLVPNAAISLASS